MVLSRQIDASTVLSFDTREIDIGRQRREKRQQKAKRKKIITIWNFAVERFPSLTLVKARYELGVCWLVL